MMKAHYCMMAGYNTWANQRLYDAAAQLSDEQYRRDCGAFFKSLHGTLNHLLVADGIWLRRFQQRSGDGSDQLDAILFDDLAALRAARVNLDQLLQDYVNALDEQQLTTTIRYRRATTPEMQEQNLSSALAHLFNHQTHHRGQAHTVLSLLHVAPPVLDLLFYQRQVAQDAQK